MCLAVVALDAHPRYRAGGRRQSRRVPRASRRTGRSGAREGWYRPAATSRPAAPGSASRRRAAGRSSPTSAKPARARPACALARRAGARRARRRRRARGRRRRAIAAAGTRYNGFNLLAGDARAVAWMSNRAPAPRRSTPGVHGLSNALLDTPWPKVGRTAAALRRWCAAGEIDARRAVRPRSPIAPSPPTTSCRRPACRWSGSGGCRRRSSSAPTTARAARRSSPIDAGATRSSSSARSPPTAAPAARSGSVSPARS